MSACHAAFESLSRQIGTVIGVSSGIEIDQSKIDQFADVTHDHQWIHIDPERAKAETPFGGTIAHGFLTLSLASQFSYEALPSLPGQVMGINYGFNRLRFLSPVSAGAKVRGRFTLKDVQKRSEHEILRETLLEIEIEGQDRLALSADWLGLTIFDT